VVNSPTTIIARTAQLTISVRWRKIRGGRMGSAIRRSSAKNAIRSATPNANGTIVPAEAMPCTSDLTTA
jgi:hypothetical protein